MTTSQPLTQLEQEVFDYLNDTPNARESRIETLAARISHEFGSRYSVASEIVQKWMEAQVAAEIADLVFNQKFWPYVSPPEGQFEKKMFIEEIQRLFHITKQVL